MKVVAVIVTYNRLADLRRCIASVREQTAPLAAIIVVDNGSTDGTDVWLAQQQGLQVIRQANLGGAGGFATGIEAGYRGGHDWIWCMDDDCVATPGALAALLEPPDIGPAIRNCMSVSNRDPSELAFYVERANRSYRKVTDMTRYDVIFGVASLFNGTLISAEVVQQIGLPDRRLFIWGDEVEYMTRAIKEGFPVVTIPRAVFYHPPAFDRQGIPWPGAWKQYYAVRNQRRVFQNVHGRRLGGLIYIRWALSTTFQQLAGRHGNRIYNFLLFAEGSIDSLCNSFRKQPGGIYTLKLYHWLHRKPVPAAPAAARPQ